MTEKLVKLDPPIGFDLESWPAILTAIGEETAAVHIDGEDLKIAAAKLPPDIRQKAHNQATD